MEGRRRHGRARRGPSRARGTLPSRRRLLAAASLMLIVAATIAIVIGASTAAGQNPLGRIGVKPRLAPGAVALGPAAPATDISGSVVLRPRDPRALESFIGEVTGKGSPLRGHYLSKGQFAARFGPSRSTIAAVEAQLKSHGAHVGGVTSNGLIVHFSGTASELSSTFATGLERYRLANGKLARATTSAPGLPGSLAGSVAAVVGLNDLGVTRRRGVHPKPNGAFVPSKAAKFTHFPGSPTACARATKAAGEFGGLTDDQIANAYGAFGLYGAGDVGSGVHIGIFEQEPFADSDIETFDSCYFGAANAASMMSRLKVISLEGGIPQGPGFYGEALLDVEDVAGMAPGADIDVYESPETAGGEVTQIAAMVDEDRDQIVTTSYGQACEEEEQIGQPGTQQTLNFLFQQAAAQGQTFLNASGDSGDDTCEEDHREKAPLPGQNPISEGEPGSQPYVLSVGGTTITDAAQPIGEEVWNNGSEEGATGGGISHFFAMPSWQRAATVPGIDLPGSADYLNAASVEKRFGYPTGFCDDNLPAAEANTPCRLEPDVSAQANWWTGAITVYSEEFKGPLGEEVAPDGWITTGGTSSSSPLWAGMLALADASPTCRNNPSTASGLGFISPLLYEVASNPSAYAASFNDITEGNNDMYGLDEGKVFPARKGYDLASGLGSPRMAGPGGTPGLAYYLCSDAAAGSARPTVSALSPSSGATAGAQQVTVTGSGFESGSAADVADIQLGVWQIPAAKIHVLSPTSLTFVTPPASDTLAPHSPAPDDGAGPIDVIVTLNSGASSASGAGSTFEYFDSAGSGFAPSVSGIQPFGGNESTPEPVTVFGSDFKGATKVTFGGVKATSFTVMNDSTIRLTPPAYSPATKCAALPSTGAYAGENATNDICQVQVVVQSANGTSATGTILPPLEGTPTYETDGALRPPAGCNCEAYPIPSEYDYAPTPKVTSISTSSGAGSLASETGGTLITIHGAGLNHELLDYVNFEEAGLEEFAELTSLITEIAYISGTEIQVTAPPLIESLTEATTEPKSVPFAVRTLAGESSTLPIEYAGVPKVSSVRTPQNKVTLNGVSGAVDTGGTPLEIRGKGLLGQVSYVHFTHSGITPSEGTSFTTGALSAKRLDTQTVSQLPTLANVEACTVTGCSATSEGDLLYLYPSGQPIVESLKPHAGSAAGGTKVVIHGQNLGCAIGVQFGASPAQSFKPFETGLGCGSTTTLEAISPKGTAGTTVGVTVSTEESYFTGTGDAPNPAGFTYEG
jgi:hypothetical protein